MFGIVPYARKNQNLMRNDVFNIDRIVNDFFNDPFFGGLEVTEKTIKADIRETEKEYIIDAELPGVDKKDINLELKDDVLSISVSQSKESKEEKDNYIRRERYYGAYTRSFYVENVNNEGVNAQYKDGILTVTLPKLEQEKQKSRNIEIQ